MGFGVWMWETKARKKSENCKKKKRRGHTHSKKKTNVMSRRERVRIGGEGGTGGWKRKVAITIAKEIKDARVKKIKKSYVPASIHHMQKTKNNNFNSQIAAWISSHPGSQIWLSETLTSNIQVQAHTKTINPNIYLHTHINKFHHKPLENHKSFIDK